MERILWTVRSIAAAVLVLSVFPAKAMSQTPSPQVPVMEPGVYDRLLSLPGAKSLRYALSVPAGYSSSRPVPLVLALHYGGAPNGAGMGVLRILVGPAFEQLGAVIVAPETLGGQWNTAENERAVISLLDAAQAAYRIDPKKVVVTGFSMGGAGTWHFAEKYPDRFAAAVPVAGRPSPSITGWKVPVFAIHSRNDEVVPIGPAEARVKELQQAGVRAEFLPLTGISHYETNRFAPALQRAVPWLNALWK